MSAPRLALGLAAVAGSIPLLARADVDLGRALFARTWVAHDPRSHGSDGLGPTFNDASCAGCHNQAGLGGAGPLAHNVGPESRQTPALFGAGLLDTVPDAVIRAGATSGPIPPGSTAVTGRVAPAIDGTVGRFGWKGEIAHLDQFVARACEAELGLQVPEPGETGTAFDLDPAELAALTAFVALLPRPPMADPHTDGSRVFFETGCADCHTRRIGAVEGAYTDLLLHDLGGILQSTASGRGSVYGGRRPELVAVTTEGPATASEWKTPALWGLADSAPYLHDGRAISVDAAILAHSGEAKESARRYVHLTDLQRSELMGFLRSL